MTRCLQSLPRVLPFIVLFVLCGCGYDGALHPPFSQETIIHQQDLQGFGCRKAPKVVRDLNIESYYKKGDATHSKVDKAAYDKQRAARKPLSDFENRLIWMTNLYALNSEPHPERAQCALDWMASWAEGRGLQGEMSRSAVHVRKWSLGTLASAYLQIRDEPALDTEKKARVEYWLSNLARDVINDYERETEEASRNNNHMYWAAYNVALAGVAVQDARFYRWGKKHVAGALRDIEKDGTMPLEMVRGSRALRYHAFAMAPLMMMADLAAKNGDDSFVKYPSLRSGAQRVLSGLDDPAFFEVKSGHKQDMKETFNASFLAWLEVYNLYYPQDGAAKWLERLRPMKQTRLGGNVTQLYGALPPMKDK